MTSEPTKAMKAVAVGRRYHISYGGLQDLQYVGDVAATFVRALEHPFQGFSPNTARQVISTVSAKVFFKGGRPRCSGRFLANLDILRLTTRGLTRLRRGSRRSWAISSSSN